MELKLYGIFVLILLSSIGKTETEGCIQLIEGGHEDEILSKMITKKINEKEMNFSKK